MSILANSRKIRKFVKKQLKPSFLLAVILGFAFPNPGYAQNSNFSRPVVGPIAEEVVAVYYDPQQTLPEIGPKQPRRSLKVVVTAYNSEPGQTDSTPFITASGTRTRDGVVAANFLPIGAIVRFPDIYGDKEFIVEDRMNARYYYRADIWMEHKADAIKFGAKYLKIEVL